MINITELANFLSIDIDDIDNISKVSNLTTCNIYITIKRKNLICPYCSCESSNLKQWKTKKISHPLIQNKITILFIKYPRYKCKACGSTYSQNCIYSPKQSRLSYEMIHQILSKLQKYNATFSSVANELNVSSTTIQNVFDNYVNPTRKKLTQVISYR